MSAIGNFLSPRPEAPPPPPPPPPSPTSPDQTTRENTQDAIRQAQERERRARGRASTLLTGGSGVEGAPTVSWRTLLGA